MRRLVLVDLDNVLGALEGPDRRRGLWLPRFVRGQWVWEPDDGADLRAEPGARGECVVVLAANTPTVRHHALEEASLTRFARRVARVFGAVDPCAVRVELALVLPTPQAADRALCQLLARAPTPEGAGAFDLVALLSRDRALRGAIEARLPAGRGVYPVRDEGGFVAAFSVLQRLWKERARRHAETPCEPVPPAPPEPGVNVERASTPGACAWAAARPVQRGATLVETARLVEENPARLTQLSLTRASFRGPARLLGSREGTVGECAPVDGLEFAREVIESHRLPAGAFRVSSLGAGALEVDPPGATVRSLLPLAWVTRQRASVEVIVGPTVSRLDDDGLLATAAPLTPTGATCRVELSVRYPSPGRAAALVAEVIPDPSGEVQGWWFGEDRRARSRCEAVGAHLMLPGAAQTLALHAVLPTGVRRELVLMAPRVRSVTAAKDAPRGAIVPCLSGGLPYAVLALDDDLGAGAYASVVPIQDLEADELERRGQGIGVEPATWAMLRRLPLLVAGG